MALGTLTFVFLMQIVYTSADDMAGGMTASLVLRFMVYVIPTLLMLTVPMSVLTGVLLGMGRLTVDSEVKSMRTHGVQMLSVFAPIFVMGLIAMVFELFNTLYLAPRMFSQSLELRDEVSFRLINSLEPTKFEDRFSTEGADVVIYFDKRDPKTQALENVYLTLQGVPGNLMGNKDKSDKKSKKNKDKDTPQMPDMPKVPSFAATTLESSGAGATEAPAAGESASAQMLAVPPGALYAAFPPAEPEMLHAPRLATKVTTPTLTVEAWFRTSAVGRNMVIASAWTAGHPADCVWMALDAEGRLGAGFHAGEAEGKIASRATGLNDGRWHYGAAVREPEGRWRLAVDGVEAADPVKGKVPEGINRVGLARPAPEQRDTEDWRGDLGTVRISDQARPMDGFAALWNEGSGTPLTEDETTAALWQPEPSPGTDALVAHESADPDADEQGPMKTVFLAGEGHIEASQGMQYAQLRLTSGTIHISRGRNDPRYTLIAFEEMTQDFELASDERETGHKERKREAMTAGEIRSELARTGLRSKRSRELLAELLQRISLSIGCFTFVLIGLPLAIYVRPSGKSVGIVIALILMACYYAFLHYGIQLARDGHMLGNMFIFLPNLLLTILGAVLLYRTCFR